MEHKKYKGLIYLRRNGFDYYSLEKEAVLRMDFNNLAVADLEVVNKEELNKQIAAFVDANKISPAAMTIIIAQDLILRKTINKPLLNQDSEEVRQYLEIVPFGEVGLKIVHTGNNTELIMTNKYLYLLIKEAFEKIGFVITHIVFAPLMDKSVASLTVLNPEAAKILLKKTGALKSENLLDEKPIDNDQSGINQPSAPKKKSLLPVLLLVFVVLFAILGFLLIKK